MDTRSQTIQVQIPAGVADGQTLRVPVNSSEAYVLLKVSYPWFPRGSYGTFEGLYDLPFEKST